MLLTVKQYSDKNGVTVQSVYAKVKRGTLETVVKDGIKYVKHPLNDSIEKNLKCKKQKKEIKYLKSILKEKEKNIETLSKSLNDYSNVLNASLNNLNLQIENKPLNKIKDDEEIIEADVKKNKKKSKKKK